MAKKNNVDWVRALEDLEAAKQLQKKKRGIPAWVWGLLPVLLLVPLMGTCGGDEKPKKNVDGATLGADGYYHTGRPAWEEAEREGRTGDISPGQEVTVAEGCWGYATLQLQHEAEAAAGKHVETYGQFNRDQAYKGQARYFSPGDRAVVVEVKRDFDAYCRIRKDGDTRAWWVLRSFLTR